MASSSRLGRYASACKALPSRSATTISLQADLHSVSTANVIPGYDARPPNPEKGSGRIGYDRPDAAMGRDYIHHVSRRDAYPSKGAYTGAYRVYIEFYQVYRIYFFCEHDFQHRKVEALLPYDGLLHDGINHPKIVYYSNPGIPSCVHEFSTDSPLPLISINDFSFTTKASGGWNFSFTCNGYTALNVATPSFYAQDGIVAKVHIEHEIVTSKTELDETGQFSFSTEWHRETWVSPEFSITSRAYDLSENSHQTKYTAVDVVTFNLTSDNSRFPAFRKAKSSSEESIPNRDPDPSLPEQTMFSRVQGWTSSEVIDIALNRRFEQYSKEYSDELIEEYKRGGLYSNIESRIFIGTERYVMRFPFGGFTSVENFPSYELKEDFELDGNAYGSISKLLTPVGYRFKVESGPRSLIPLLKCYKLSSLAPSSNAYDAGKLLLSSISKSLKMSSYNGGFHAEKGAKIKDNFVFEFTSAGFHTVKLSNAIISPHYYISNIGGYIDLISSFDGPDPQNSGYNGTSIFNRNNLANIINRPKNGTGVVESLTLAVYPSENPPLDLPIYCKLVVQGVPYDGSTSRSDVKWSIHYPEQSLLNGYALSPRQTRRSIDQSILPSRDMALSALPDIMREINKDYDTLNLSLEYPYLNMRIGDFIYGADRFIPGTSGNWSVETLSVSISNSRAETKIEIIRAG